MVAAINKIETECEYLEKFLDKFTKSCTEDKQAENL